jgi:predicted nucleic acid-binding protein
MTEQNQTPAQGVIIDSSVALSWCFPDENNPYAREVLRSLPTMVAHVPSLWTLEIANSLLVGERRNRLTEADSLRFIGILATLPIHVDRETPNHALHDTLDLARRQQLSAYDGSYLELAMRRGLPLATLDQRLRDAAAAVGVELYTAS